MASILNLNLVTVEHISYIVFVKNKLRYGAISCILLGKANISLKVLRPKIISICYNSCTYPQKRENPLDHC